MNKITMLLIAIGLILGSSVYAQPEHFSNMDNLGLTDNQQAEMDDLRFQHRKSMIKKKAMLEEAQLEFQKLMSNIEIDEKAVLEKQKKVSSLKGEMAKSRIKHRLAMRKVLNKEQTKKMLKSQRGMGEGRGFHRGGKPRYGMEQGDRMGPCGGPGMGPR